MTAPDRTYDRVRFHRGSRGFAAFVTGLNAAILLGLALFVTPTLGLDQPAASWFVILAGRRRHRPPRGGRRPDPRPRLERRARRLPRRRRDRGRRVRRPRGRRPGWRSSAPSRGNALGFFVWMIGSWLVATRFALKAFTYTRPGPASGPAPRRATGPGRPSADRPAQGPPAGRCSSRPLGPPGPPAADPADRPPDAAAPPAARTERPAGLAPLRRSRRPDRLAAAWCVAATTVADRRLLVRVRYVIWPIRDMTFARFRAVTSRRRMAAMDTLGMVILAISAFALLELAAANLRGEERHARARRHAVRR